LKDPIPVGITLIKRRVSPLWLYFFKTWICRSK